MLLGPFLPQKRRKAAQKDWRLDKQHCLLTNCLAVRERMKMTSSVGSSLCTRWEKRATPYSTVVCKARRSSKAANASYTSCSQQYNRAIQSREHYPHLPCRLKRIPSALPRTSDMIRRFNRDTGWVATAVLGTVIFATLVLAVQVQERHQKRHDLTQEARQVRRDFLLNANPATRFTGVGLDGKTSIGKMTSEHASSVDHAPTEISPEENSSSQPEAAASTPSRIHA